MASAGSFDNGNGGRRKSRDEQDIADFLSSIDEITNSGSTSTAAAAAAGAGSGISYRGGSSPGGDLFFGPTSPSTQATAGSTRGILLGSDEAAADPVPADWLKDFEAVQLGRDGSSAHLGEPARADNGQAQQPKYANGTEEEILGLEPEILDDGGNDENSSSNKGSANISGSGMSRGEIRDVVGSRIGPSNAAGGNETAAVAAVQEPLDWPGTLDMLGIAEEQNAGTAAAAVGVPVSELPSMPPPAAREETFLDFVEIRDPRHVSQFPRPDNALAAKTAAAGAAGDGGGGGDVGAQGDGDRGGQGTAAGHRRAPPAPLRTVEVYLRPDVTWESASDVYMAVMLSRGLVVRQQTEKMVSPGGRRGDGRSGRNAWYEKFAEAI